MRKLNQLLAIEKGVKQRVHETLTKAYHGFQKPALFNGQTRMYSKNDENGEDLPAEHVRVQLDATQTLRDIGSALVELIDTTAAKDKANQEAVADIKISDTEILARDVPATTLLFLEKTLTDLKSEIIKLPELDPAQDWVRDEQNQIYRATPVTTVRTKKVAKVLVKYEATKEHPAQTEVVTEDVPVGKWTLTAFSGAVSRRDKRALLERVTVLIDAVKIARETANEAPAPSTDLGKSLIDFVLGAR